MVSVCYSKAGGTVRRVSLVGGRAYSTVVPDVTGGEWHAFSAWWWNWLRLRPLAPARVGAKTIRAVELFSGSGGLALGIWEAARAIGAELDILLAVDNDRAALAVYERNLPVRHALHEDVTELVSYVLPTWSVATSFADGPRPRGRYLSAAAGCTDLFFAGPPCEGHSNLNNRTRRDDPRNLLVVDAVAAAIAVKARAIIIENVPAALHDKRGSILTARSLLRSNGYSERIVVVDGTRVGLPQRRTRMFLLAASEFEVNDLVVPALQDYTGPHTVRWAIADLAGRAGETPFHTPSVLSAENQARALFLHEHGLFDLPDELRPHCHRNGHTYPSVYGRMSWDEPAQTITSGFTSPGRGRFIHPSEPRALTPHEAARLQTFPDWYDWSPPGLKPSKRVWTKLIGDAVPPMLAFAVALPVVAALVEP